MAEMEALEAYTIRPVREWSDEALLRFGQVLLRAFAASGGDVPDRVVSLAEQVADELERRFGVPPEQE